MSVMRMCPWYRNNSTTWIGPKHTRMFAGILQRYAEALEILKSSMEAVNEREANQHQECGFGHVHAYMPLGINLTLRYAIRPINVEVPWNSTEEWMVQR